MQQLTWETIQLFKVVMFEPGKIPTCIVMLTFHFFGKKKRRMASICSNSAHNAIAFQSGSQTVRQLINILNILFFRLVSDDLQSLSSTL